MPAPRVFTADELSLARQMRADKASWRSVGRELGCNDDTIRCALDPEFLRKRHDRIVALKRKRLDAAQVVREAKDALSNSAYGASRIQSGHPKRLGIHRGNLRGFY